MHNPRHSPSERPDIEIRADTDAVEFCVPQKELANFIVRKDPYYSQQKIEGFAYVQKIHPGIVAGQLQKHGRVGWSHHRKLLVKIRDIITEPSLTDGYGFETR